MSNRRGGISPPANTRCDKKRVAKRLPYKQISAEIVFSLPICDIIETIKLWRSKYVA